MMSDKGLTTMFDERLCLHVSAGAAIKTGKMGKALIDVLDDGDLRLDFENTENEEVLSPSQLENIINAEVLDDIPVKVWFMPESDNSRKLSVPVTETTQIKTDDGAWGPKAIDKMHDFDRINDILRETHGWDQSSP